MSVLRIAEVTFGFANPPLLQETTLDVERGERVGLLGRNGVGKSTLLRLIAGELTPDSGSIAFEVGARAAYLSQHVPADLGGTIFDRVADGFGKVGGDISTYHRLTVQAETSELSDEDQTLLAHCADQIGETNSWDTFHLIERTLSEMNLDGDGSFDSLSAGSKRRVLLARVIASNPDILMLDEPTNHLDIEAIVWLQDYLLQFTGTVIFVTHDRTFLQALATRIIELDRGRMFDFTLDYASFLKQRYDLLENEAKQQAQFDKKLAEEERWLRKGIKARRKRNVGRVRALAAMREERQARRHQVGTVHMEATEAARSGQRVVQAKEISFSYGDQLIVSNFSTEIWRKDRIGLIGPNGVGKTTLLRILMGQLEPSSGTVKLGTQLAVAYFDQLRQQLDETKTVQECVADGQDTIEFNGRTRHVLGYLQNFLFPPDRARMGVDVLSGGERNRLLLARLFARPSNVLVLDEPTNDLDTETLELLEELLADYAGTVFLVSHDRSFLNNVVTSTIAFEGNGKIKEYAGGYDDYLRQHQAARRAATSNRSKAVLPASPSDPSAPRKLTFKEQRELESLPQAIEELETRQNGLHQKMADPGYHRQSAYQIKDARDELELIGQELLAAYSRWEALESIAADKK